MTEAEIRQYGMRCAVLARAERKARERTDAAARELDRRMPTNDDYDV